MIELLIIKGNEKGGKVAEYKEYVLSTERNSLSGTLRHYTHIV